MNLILVEIYLSLKFSFGLDVQHFAAVCYLQFHLRETPVYFFEKAVHNQTWIVVTGVDFSSYMLTDKKSASHVKVEKIPMCRCVDFIHTFTVMIALHFVFSVAYSKIIEAKMVFIQLINGYFSTWMTIKKILPKMLSLIGNLKVFEKKSKSSITRLDNLV